MQSSDVRDLCRELDDLGIPIWLDGGWAVDALLGEQTRPHDDLDIVIEQQHLSRLCEHLRGKGYADVPRDDTSPWNFVLGDEQGRQVDIHVISFFDETGNGIYGPVEDRVRMPTLSSAADEAATACGKPARKIGKDASSKAERSVRKRRRRSYPAGAKMRSGMAATSG
jgi:lincosamide nucleotidyltransferase A/C/D/E